jgi:hypothetical protein
MLCRTPESGRTRGWRVRGLAAHDAEIDTEEALRRVKHVPGGPP